MRFKNLDWLENCKSYILVNLLTTLGALPFAIGVGAAVILRSVLLLLFACILGGCCFGPVLSGMIDCILRKFRHCQDDWWASYRRAWKQNWKGSLVPGILLCLFWGFLGFMGLQMYWTTGTIPFITILLILISAIFAVILSSVYWVQMVLFQQSSIITLRNCLIFGASHFPSCLISALMQIAWGVLLFCGAPWSIQLIPILGFCLILYWSMKILYPHLNRDFRIEELIAERFPGQMIP